LSRLKLRHGPDLEATLAVAELAPVAGDHTGFFADPVYGGNKDMASWKMIGFPGAHYNYREWVDRHNQPVTLAPVSIKADRQARGPRLGRMFPSGPYWPSRFSSEVAPSYSTKVLGQVSAATCNDALASPLLPRSSSHSPA
jgi:hypothetical protein